MKLMCEEVLNDASGIPWFANVGASAVQGKQAVRWPEWPGPEAAGVERLSLDLQALKNELQRETPELFEKWDECVSRLVASISARVPEFRSDEDAWHAPTAAVWHAAWVSALRSVFTALGRPIPAMVADQWEWFAKGRWPAAYSPITSDAPVKEYKVF
jgi:hypothetical protein